MGRHFALVAIALLCALPIHAQEQGGSIQGIVKDPSGAILPGVTIEVRSPSVVGVNTTITDELGVYRFPALPSGVYELTAKLPGFADRKVTDVLLQLGQTLKIDLQLAVAGTVQEVLVVEEAPIIDVKQNAAAANISQDIIDRIPKGRDFTSVVATAPGVSDESRAGGLQIDGSSGSENRFIIDGMDTTNLRTGVSSKTLYVDFLEEVQVKSSGYSAEYGGATGGVISAVTKAGGNSYHGSVGGYYRNQKMQGNVRGSWRVDPLTDCNTCSGTPQFLKTPDSPFQIYTPLADFGGPVLKDKLWFYAAGSYNRQNNQRHVFFHTLAPPFPERNFNWWSDSKYLNWNVTSQLNNKMRVRVSGGNTRGASRGSAPSYTPSGTVFSDGVPTHLMTTSAFDTDPEAFKDRWERTGDNTRNDLYTVNYDWVITPKLFVNIQSGYLAYDRNTPAEFAGKEIIHSFSTTNQCVGAAGSSTCPYPEIPSNLQFVSGYSDNKSTAQTVKDLYTRSYANANTSLFKNWLGDHQFKFGVRFERLGNDVDDGRRQPTISLNWNRTRSTLDGRNVRGAYGYYTVTRNVVSFGNVHSNNWSFWAQDSWTIKHDFTLNAGVRTENEHVPSYVQGLPGIEFGFRDKIAPRIGFAYDVTGNGLWKVYGSYGRYFDITKLEMPRGSFGADHWITYYWTLDTFNWPSIKCQEGPTGCPGTFIEQVDNRHAANAADPNLTAFFGHEQNTIEPNLKPVQTGELTFGLDHELSGKMSIGVRYTHKWLDRTIEDSGINVPGVGEVFFIANPGFGVAKQILPKPAPPLPTAQRDYDGVEFRFRKLLAKRWSLNSSYLWSRLFGNYGGLASSDENGRNAPNVDRYFDGEYLLFDSKGKPVLGLLPTDRPHNYKSQVTYDAPWGTRVGLDSQVSSGNPLSTNISLLSYSPTFINGRGDLGRTPILSQFDMFLQHDLKLPGTEKKINLNGNVDNLFDQKTVLNQTATPWRDNFSVPASLAAATAPPGVLTPRDAYLLAGYDPVALSAAIRAAGGRHRKNSLFGMPSAVQGRRVVRLGMKYNF